MKNTWKTVTALCAVYLAIWFNQNWPWGVLFLYWVFNGWRTGVAYLVEDIERGEYPVLYWLIMFTWLWLSIYMILEPFFANTSWYNGGY